MFFFLCLRIVALSGDFCISPDANANEVIINSNSGDAVEELLLYYTGNCTTENTAVDMIASAQETVVEVIPSALPMLYNVSFFPGCPAFFFGPWQHSHNIDNFCRPIQESF